MSKSLKINDEELENVSGGGIPDNFNTSGPKYSPDSTVYVTKDLTGKIRDIRVIESYKMKLYMYYVYVEFYQEVRAYKESDLDKYN